ncbi:uncharacterized protein LOC136034870 [Artemia franciscana]|uniref:uncharacterized protein LOC136034870 n=1 Tax=Artemia franciscana TaxID=6661 RepID=UPI0032D9F023
MSFSMPSMPQPLPAPAVASQAQVSAAGQMNGVPQFVPQYFIAQAPAPVEVEEVDEEEDENLFALMKKKWPLLLPLLLVGLPAAVAVVVVVVVAVTRVIVVVVANFFPSIFPSLNQDRDKNKKPKPYPRPYHKKPYIAETYEKPAYDMYDKPAYEKPYSARTYRQIPSPLLNFRLINGLSNLILPMLNTEDCLERIACELGQMSKKMSPLAPSLIDLANKKFLKDKSPNFRASLTPNYAGAPYAPSYASSPYAPGYAKSPYATGSSNDQEDSHDPDYADVVAALKSGKCSKLKCTPFGLFQ